MRLLLVDGRHRDVHNPVARPTPAGLDREDGLATPVPTTPCPSRSTVMDSKPGTVPGSAASQKLMANQPIALMSKAVLAMLTIAKPSVTGGSCWIWRHANWHGQMPYGYARIARSAMGNCLCSCALATGLDARAQLPLASAIENN